MVSFTPRPIYCQGKRPWYTLISGKIDTKANLYALGGGRSLAPARNETKKVIMR
jgi:hypothetical protein